MIKRFDFFSSAPRTSICTSYGGPHSSPHSQAKPSRHHLFGVLHHPPGGSIGNAFYSVGPGKEDGGPLASALLRMGCGGHCHRNFFGKLAISWTAGTNPGSQFVCFSSSPVWASNWFGLPVVSEAPALEQGFLVSMIFCLILLPPYN